MNIEPLGSTCHFFGSLTTNLDQSPIFRLGARNYLVTKGIATRSKDATWGAPGLTSNKGLYQFSGHSAPVTPGLSGSRSAALGGVELVESNHEGAILGCFDTKKQNCRKKSVHDFWGHEYSSVSECHYRSRCVYHAYT